MASAAEIAQSVNNAYRGCKTQTWVIRYAGGSWNAEVICSCEWIFRGEGHDVDEAMLRTRISYTDFHDKNYKPKKR